MKRRWKRWIAAAMAGLMMCMIGGVMPGAAPEMSAQMTAEAADSYVPRTTEPSRTDPNYFSNNPYYQSGYGLPNCTCYAYGRAMELLGYKPNLSRGNADAWWGYNQSTGAFPSGSEPKLGAIACWSTQHVAVVEAIDGDTVWLSESSYPNEWFPNGIYFRYISKNRYEMGNGFQGYIYIGDWTDIPQGHVMSESDGAGQTIPDGDYYIYNALDCHYYMDLPARELESGDNVKMWNDENKLPGLHYAWTVTYRGNGFYKIKQKETNLCLDVEYGNLAKGTYVWIWKDDNSNEQQWSIDRTETGYTITSRANAWCLDVEGYDGVSNGSNVHVWSDNGNPYQRWCFIPAEPKPIVEDGIYQIKSSKDTNYALSVGEVKDNFAKLELWNTAERSTYFKITHQEGGYYKLQELSSGSYLDLPDSDYMNVKNDFRINVDTDTRDKLYAFLPLYDGTYTIVSQYSGYAMDLLDGKVENGTTIRQFTYNSPTASPAERWILEKITPLDLVSGDVNANGTFNLVDLVLVQKWLHADPLTELTDPDAADANQDGLIDIYDLALLKRKLLKLQTPVVQDVPLEPPPDEPPHPTDPGFEQWQ